MWLADPVASKASFLLLSLYYQDWQWKDTWGRRTQKALRLQSSISRNVRFNRNSDCLILFWVRVWLTFPITDIENSLRGTTFYISLRASHGFSINIFGLELTWEKFSYLKEKKKSLNFQKERESICCSRNYMTFGVRQALLKSPDLPGVGVGTSYFNYLSLSFFDCKM